MSIIKVPFKASLMRLEERYWHHSTTFVIGVEPEHLQSRGLPSNNSIYRPISQLEIHVGQPNEQNEYLNSLIDAVRAEEKVEFDGTYLYGTRPFFVLIIGSFNLLFEGFNYQRAMSSIEEMIPKGLEGGLIIKGCTYCIDYRLPTHHFTIGPESSSERKRA
ncbi:hypothetical protein HYT57_01040 [Candidatus Woesearchaeota archaeon]|nr:hypothetical protein [Candidatus Woesearchaeota archaeon]